ncbi:MAG: hypothetical protein U0990_04035 [Candidatus Nanopelagicales bacterium]|nr:hypothetical protein [Hyphomicrobiales bacterium]MDZ4249243.1 hypothetical protein [Candidatus Nanopelagicales bacterium]
MDQERIYLRRIVGIVLAAVAFFCLIVLGARYAYAEETYSAADQNGKLTIMLVTPCPLGPWFKDWKAAKWIFRGQFYDACWRVQPTSDGRPQIVVIDSSGVMSSQSPGAFRKDEGV